MSQVKEFKISLITLQYEAFEIEDGESINVMHNQFNNIVVVLQNHGKELAQNEINTY